MLDYDKVAVINLDEKVEKASKSKISMVVYRTISGNGLRILLRYKRPAGCTLTATDLHRLAINKAMAYFNWNAEPLDITPKDVTRFYNTILKPEEEKRQEMEKNIRESKATRNKNSGRSNASHTKDAPPTTEEITEYVKKLAEMLNMSQPTLYRRVKQLTNFTIIELVRGVRLKRSAELLRTKKYSVQEVAEMVGYNDIPTFRKHFVDFYGTTPSTFNSKEDTEDKK